MHFLVPLLNDRRTESAEQEATDQESDELFSSHPSSPANPSVSTARSAGDPAAPYLPLNQQHGLPWARGGN
ncbi:hypothetical protein AOXY_G5363 [Acipenser oxyrinchus oxyrinchus]|uniref:Uncharacterized protein n=1 Tax=Acipenser oxyrinchus oxyrinchus TaxID=40147 RepID=A0AAD8GE25_ACIOX|nr:hypothetical protein AOXY_G5363 [Acipenser oxyrinchus oxyrinchus]